MLHQIALYIFLGRPLFIFVGLLGYLLLLFTASIAVSNRIGKPILPFHWHPRMAKISIGVITVHVLLALSIAFNF